MRAAPSCEQPGVIDAYSNLGFVSFSGEFEKVSGQDFAGYVRTQVLVPLGMSGPTSSRPKP